MSTAKPARSHGFTDSSDPSVDELLDEFSPVDPEACDRILRGRLAAESVEIGQDENTEELIAPEVLFPEEYGEAG